ncbi:hypothetical protein [Massilia sp. TWR1-2-2]|uniref:hypothetical protein n=1 Tax=Massilia sp. TWR1-2-2 TaxID=2804584 RepID=UPI003CF3C228
MENSTPYDPTFDPLQRHQAQDDNGERSLGITVSTRASLAIERLARRYEIDQRDVIERLALAEDDRITAGIRNVSITLRQ